MKWSIGNQLWMNGKKEKVINLHDKAIAMPLFVNQDQEITRGELMSGSKIAQMLTFEYMQTEHENKYFDRKSAAIRPSDLAPHISGFANADGGTLVIGISDKKLTLEGINSVGEDKINELLNAPRDCCRPMPQYQEEFIDITNEKGQPDRLLLLHIESSLDQIIRTSNDKTYLRIGDKTREMLGDNLRNLEYAKGSRHYEEEFCPYAKVEDLDEELLKAYEKRIGAEGLPFRQVLRARGFLTEQNGEERLTNAAVLLFAKNVMQFPVSCRVRIIQIDGRQMQVGEKYNVVKDKNLDEPILRLVDDAKAYISGQLRDFMHQNRVSGRFESSPEYPRFPWEEGLINAIAHRDYAATGQYIKVSLYDDRMEIETPGRLPNIVTVDNITYTRFSRNKKISRVMTEFEWVRELNEGVKKIYSDMEEAGLPKPEYVEGPNTVTLILRNNIDERMPSRSKTVDITNNSSDKTPDDVLNEALWQSLDELDRQIISFIQEHGSVRRGEIEAYVKRPGRTIVNHLNQLMQKNIIQANGNSHDPKRTYGLVKKI